MTASTRDPRSVRTAMRHGCPRYLARTLHHCSEVNHVPYSLLLAVCEHESGFRNVWGHDAGKFRYGDEVTAEGIRRYWDASRSERPNGIGPMQITSAGLQHEAQQRGGLHDPRVTSRVGAEYLAQLVHRMGQHAGVRAYNGSGPAAERYANAVLASAQRWHARLSQ